MFAFFKRIGQAQDLPLHFVFAAHFIFDYCLNLRQSTGENEYGNERGAFY
jgi:hypothetical protein